MPKGVYDRKPMADRIKENIDICPERGCWLWKLRTEKDGYGQISDKCKTSRAHRVAYETFKEPIAKGMLCVHTCDEKYPVDSKEYRRCCNPEHIVIETAAQNSARMKALGRSKPSAGTFKKGECVGEKNLNAKLKDEQILEILEEKKKGIPYGGLKKIAEKYNVSVITIQKYIGGERRPDLYEKVFPPGSLA